MVHPRQGALAVSTITWATCNQAAPQALALPLEPCHGCSWLRVVSSRMSHPAVCRLREAHRPSPADLEARDPEGMYSPEQPFWAPVSDSRRLTAASSDRTVRTRTDRLAILSDTCTQQHPTAHTSLPS